MKKAMKFLIPVLGNASLIFADGNGNECCPQPKKECKTTCKEVCAPCPTKKICKTTCVEVRPKPPCECVTRACDCGVDFFITADFTWWKAKEDGLEFASTQPCNQGPNYVGPSGLNNSCGPLLVEPTQGKVYNTHSKYKPGFKVGIGLDFCDWGWDLYANYTWFRTNHDNSNNNSEGTSVTPASGLFLFDSYWSAGMPQGQGPAIYSSASSKWNLRLNVIDLELGRKFWIGKHIMFRPHAGFKGVWNRQNLHNRYNNYSPAQNGDDTPMPVGGYVDMFNHIKADGIGIRCGFDGAWHFSRGFSIIGNYALTGLWQQFKMHRYDQVTDGRNVEYGYPVYFKDKFYTVTPVFEWMLGLKWETWWSGDNYHFAIRAAWEEQVWLDQNRFLRLPGSAKPSGDSDLSLQGLTLGVMFEF